MLTEGLGNSALITGGLGGQAGAPPTPPPRMFVGSGGGSGGGYRMRGDNRDIFRMFPPVPPVAAITAEVLEPEPDDTAQDVVSGAVSGYAVLSGVSAIASAIADGGAVAAGATIGKLLAGGALAVKGGKGIAKLVKKRRGKKKPKP